MAAKRQHDDVEGAAAAAACKKIYGDDTLFSSFPDKLRKRIAKHLDDLCCEGDFVLRTLKILNCNCADYSGGVSFSKAYCSVTPGKRTLVFGSVFLTGIKMLTAFLKYRHIPQNLQEKFILKRLLLFISDKKTCVPLKNLGRFTETELPVVLANHLFGKLAASSNIVFDKNSTQTSKDCPCRSKDCSLSCSFGDTSIGNEQVWHGNMDILIDNDVIGVSCPSESVGDSPRGKSTVEVKSKHSNLYRNQQIISETIVFSFLQKKRHPESSHFLFPCIGIERTGMVIYFYDSEKDVLLESSHIPLSENPASSKVNMKAILASWLVANYKYLSSGLPHSGVSEEKSGFFALAEDKIEIYKQDLILGNVGTSVHEQDMLDESDSDLDIEEAPYLSKLHLELSSIGWK